MKLLIFVIIDFGFLAVSNIPFTRGENYIAAIVTYCLLLLFDIVIDKDRLIKSYNVDQEIKARHDLAKTGMARRKSEKL